MYMKIKVFVFITLQNTLGDVVKVLSIVINGFFFMKYGRLLEYGNIQKLIMEKLTKSELEKIRPRWYQKTYLHHQHRGRLSSPDSQGNKK